MDGTLCRPGEGESLAMGPNNITTLTVLLGDAEHAAGPGTFVCAPPGVVHTFRNDSDLPVRFLNANTPGGFEAYMRELSASAADGPMTSEEIGAIAARYDFMPAIG
jgi:oxalate decarboxylase/phosphoglucose isomerase-like protein (cupin superfamily)